MTSSFMCLHESGAVRNTSAVGGDLVITASPRAGTECALQMIEIIVCRPIALS